MPGISGNIDSEAGRPILMAKASNPTPDTLTKLIKRLRSLTLALLPVEVDHSSINDPTSRVITPQVISAYMAAAGDFLDALPYALLRARAEFIWDANHDPADFGENRCRAIACEVLARRIVHQAAPDKQGPIMATRYKHKLVDGDESEMASALETAIDTRCTIFLSSSEAQAVVNSIWNGDFIQKTNENDDIDFMPYRETRENTYWGHFDHSRLSVPRYQNFFRIVVWLFFLVVYSQAVREPTERLDESRPGLDGWEIILYFLGLSFFIEDMNKFYKLLRFVTWRAFSFWNVIAFITDSLLFAAFVYRVLGLQADGVRQAELRLRSFQILSFISPFIWMKLVTIFDGFKYIGTMQICIARMLQESGIFFALLSVLAIGFGQGLFALDAADGQLESPFIIVNLLVQALFGSADFGKFGNSPIGLMLYYLWNLVTAVVLLNVLISLFSSAYSDIVDDAEAQYLAFFASKTIGMIRAPDEFVYPAPFNIVEVIFISPFELIPGFSLSDKNYEKLNHHVMNFVFFIPLMMIAIFEARRATRKNSWMGNWLQAVDESTEESPEDRDPQVDNDDGGRITRVRFKELIRVFPNTQQSSEASILKEIGELKKALDALTKRLDGGSGQ